MCVCDEKNGLITHSSRVLASCHHGELGIEGHEEVRLENVKAVFLIGRQTDKHLFCIQL